MNRIYKEYGEEVYLYFKNHQTIKIYNFYIKNLKHVPNLIKNKDDYLLIIDYLVKSKINKYNINYSELSSMHRLKNIINIVSKHDVFVHLFGEEYYLYPWRYDDFKFKEIKLTYEIANKVLNNYIKEFDIKIDNIFTYNYNEITKNSGLKCITNPDVLYFIVQFYEFKYPGYMFKTSSVNYYKNDKMVLFDLKYLIEKDMQIPIDKIPLYLTRNILQKNCRPLYNFIIVNKNGSIYEWVNKLYPEKFIGADFEVNAYRNEFDSDTECFIHEILISEFDSVLYNPKHNERTITIDGMIPDWFVFTDKGVWIIEYFGMYVERQRGNSSRIDDYIEKTHRKLERYKNIKGYKFLWLYPEDVDNDYFGIREKLKIIR